MFLAAGQSQLAHAACDEGARQAIDLFEAEQVLAGQQASEALFREAGEIASRDLEPDGDIHASAEYRKEVAAVVVRRALMSAAERMGAS